MKIYRRYIVLSVLVVAAAGLVYAQYPRDKTESIAVKALWPDFTVDDKRIKLDGDRNPETGLGGTEYFSLGTNMSYKPGSAKAEITKLEGIIQSAKLTFTIKALAKSSFEWNGTKGRVTWKFTPVMVKGKYDNGIFAHDIKNAAIDEAGEVEVSVYIDHLRVTN